MSNTIRRIKGYNWWESKEYESRWLLPSGERVKWKDDFPRRYYTDNRRKSDNALIKYFNNIYQRSNRKTQLHNILKLEDYEDSDYIEHKGLKSLRFMLS